MMLFLLAAQVAIPGPPRAQTQQGTPSTNLAVLGTLNGQDVESIATIVMMNVTKDANDDLKSIMQDLARMNRDKAEARDLLEAMKKEQARLSADPELAPRQQEWAVSLVSLCPPGASRDDCLLQQLRLRSAVLRDQQSLRRRDR